ncbi:MAG: septation protein SpoVG family protein [Candidatus Omnitrophica bacterium]|nr:septation protein SpoVG family protein [Candidatus Omnitrophota bacterium]
MPIDTFDVKVVKIHRLHQESRIKAFVDLGVNDALVIKGLRVVQGKKGLFVAMPSEQGKNERWYERVQCVDKDVRSMISSKVLESYTT